MSNNSKAWSTLWLILFLLVCAVPLFWQLDSLPLRMWDEARRGVNALEMARDGNWLVPHFLGAPDNWGTKPPLLIWMQSFFLQFFDSPEIAIRLPSALAGIFTALLLAWVGKYILNRPLAGGLAALVLLTSTIYMGAHGAVAGDYDAILTLWLSAQVFCFYLYVKEKRNRWLYLLGVLVLLAGWTKGIAAFFFAPGFAVYALSNTERRTIFLQSKLYLVALAAFCGILSYYLMRDSFHPGYLTTVWENELGGRYLQAKEGHNWGFGFYFRLVHKYKLFFPWQYFLPLGFGLLLLEKKTRSLGQLLLIVSIVFLIVISASATKLEWYVLPIIPILSLVVGCSLERLGEGLVLLLQKSIPAPVSYRLRIIYKSLFILAIFTFPYLNVLQEAAKTVIKDWESEKQVYREFFRQLPAEQAFTTVLPTYNGHFSFYQQVFNQRGYDISAVYLKAPPSLAQPNADTVTSLETDTNVVFCEAKAKAFIDKNYTFEQVNSWNNCHLVHLTARKFSERKD